MCEKVYKHSCALDKLHLILDQTKVLVCVCVPDGFQEQNTSVLVCSDDPLDDGVADFVVHHAVVCAAYEELVLYQQTGERDQRSASRHVTTNNTHQKVIVFTACVPIPFKC